MNTVANLRERRQRAKTHGLENIKQLYVEEDVTVYLHQDSISFESRLPIKLKVTSTIQQLSVSTSDSKYAESRIQENVKRRRRVDDLRQCNIKKSIIIQDSKIQKIELCRNAILRIKDTALLDCKDLTVMMYDFSMLYVGDTQTILGEPLNTFVIEKLTCGMCGHAHMSTEKRAPYLIVEQLHLNMCEYATISCVNVLYSVDGNISGCTKMQNVKAGLECVNHLGITGCGSVEIDGKISYSQEEEGEEASADIVEQIVGIGSAISGGGILRSLLNPQYKLNKEQNNETPADEKKHTNKPYIPPGIEDEGLLEYSNSNVTAIENEKKIVKRRKRRFGEYGYDNHQEGLETIEGEDNRDDNDASENPFKCNFCWMNKIKLCAKPCRHTHYCVSCATRTKNDNNKLCYTCRQPIERFTAVYI